MGGQELHLTTKYVSNSKPIGRSACRMKMYMFLRLLCEATFFFDIVGSVSSFKSMFLRVRTLKKHLYVR